MPHHYTKEQADFIRENVKGSTSKELTQMVNDQFGLNLGANQIRAYMKNHALTNGVNRQFKPGHTPFNKGKKGITQGGESTQFKKGHKPYNYMPVGTERVNGDGYVDIKIADPNKWRAKHLLIWERANGPVPKGHVVIFGNGNRRNFDLNNLILVSRKQLALLNKGGLIQNNADLTRTGIIMTDIYQKIGERKKKQTKQES
jgi:hypothetical protein